MTPKEMADKILSMQPNAEAGVRYGNQLEIRVPHDSIVGLLTILKSQGFDHLVNITCVDWLKDDRFDVTYNLWSYGYKMHATVKTGVVREKPELATALDLWPQARVYEQEIHEMFGVVFEGNPTLDPLFLHNWQDIPPLRKDFDTERYARKAFGAESHRGEQA